MVLEGDLRGVLDLGVGAAERGAESRGGHRGSGADLARQPTSAPEIEALVLMMPPTAAAVSRKSRMPAWVAPMQWSR